jgi:hypothetical protein
MESGQVPGAPSVVVVAVDERALRVLEITIRLGGYQPLARRTIEEATRVREGEAAPVATVVELRDLDGDELAELAALVEGAAAPVAVIVPQPFAAERERVAAVGATVLVHPYRPSDLYALLPSPDGGAAGEASS